MPDSRYDPKLAQAAREAQQKRYREYQVIGERTRPTELVEQDRLRAQGRVTGSDWDHIAESEKPQTKLPAKSASPSQPGYTPEFAKPKPPSAARLKELDD